MCQRCACTYILSFDPPHPEYVGFIRIGEAGGKRSWRTCHSPSATVEQNQSLFLVYHFHNFIFILLNLFFWPACGILVPRPGIEPTPTSLEAWSLNHWTTREVPHHRSLVAGPTSFPGSLCLPSSRTTPQKKRKHWRVPRGGPVLWLVGGSLPQRVPSSPFPRLSEIGCSLVRCSWLTWGLGTSFPSLLGTRRSFCFEFHLQSWLLVEKPSPWGGMSRFAVCSLWVWLSAWRIWGLCF